MSTDTLLGHSLGGRYSILDKVGEEMLGRVYKARDTQSDQLVSVKVLHPYLAQNPEKVRRFAREITATSAVRHPGSVQVLDFGEHQGQHYFVLEYLRAQTLHDLLQQGKIPFERAASIAAQIAAALDAAHDGGVVHRNLNPHTILLLENARGGDYVKVRDFGLSRLEEGDDGGEALTATGARVGNSAYMAPEYIEESTVTPQGDLYALGCLLFHMVCGRPPFDGKPGQVLMMHISHSPEVPSRLAPGTPAWMDRAILHMLEKDPARRPSRGRMVVGALEQGAAKALKPPQLDPLDRNGEIVAAPTRSGTSTAAVLAGGTTLVILGGLAVLALFVVALLVWMFVI